MLLFIMHIKLNTLNAHQPLGTLTHILERQTDSAIIIYTMGVNTKTNHSPRPLLGIFPISFCPPVCDFLYY